MTADPLADVLRNAHEGRFKNAYVEVPEVGVPLEMFAALQADAIRAALANGTLTPEDLGIRGGIPTDCNCGFGGQHDSENPRCTANRLPAPSREDGA